eukprot:s783_g2.t4
MTGGCALPRFDCIFQKHVHGFVRLKPFFWCDSATLLFCCSRSVADRILNTDKQPWASASNAAATSTDLRGLANACACKLRPPMQHIPAHYAKLQRALEKTAGGEAFVSAMSFGKLQSTAAQATMESHWQACQFWDASVPVWSSSYVVAGICLACAVLSGMNQASTASQFFLIFASASCLTFGLGGTAFMLLYLKPCSHEWSKPNHEWMYCWAFTLAFWPFSTAALAAVALSITSFGASHRLPSIGFVVLLTVIAFGLAAYETLWFVRGEPLSLVYKFGSLFMAACAILVPLLEALSSRFRPQHLLMILSGLMYVIGGIVELEFPIDGAYNESFLYHILVCLSVMFAYCACQTRRSLSHIQEGDRKLQERERSPLVEESAKENAGEEQPCCFCFRSPFRRKEASPQWTYVSQDPRGPN